MASVRSVIAAVGCALLAGCTGSGEFVRSGDAFITMMPHGGSCRCVGTAEYWKVDGNVIVEGGRIGNDPIDRATRPAGERYTKASGTIEVNQAGNRIVLDAYVRSGEGSRHRSGTFYLKQDRK